MWEPSTMYSQCTRTCKQSLYVTMFRHFARAFFSHSLSLSVVDMWKLFRPKHSLCIYNNVLCLRTRERALAIFLFFFFCFWCWFSFYFCFRFCFCYMFTSVLFTVSVWCNFCFFFSFLLHSIHRVIKKSILILFSVLFLFCFHFQLLVCFTVLLA